MGLHRHRAVAVLQPVLDGVGDQLGEHGGQRLGGIGLDDADIVHVGLDSLRDQFRDAGNPHLEGQEVALGVGGGRRDDLLARA